MKDLIRRWPKSELHVHLRGAMPPELLAEQLRKYPVEQALRDAPWRHRALFRRCGNIRPFLARRARSGDDVSNLFHYTSFRQFLVTYLFTGYFFREASDLRRLVQGVLARLAAENVVYAEITVSVPEYRDKGMALSEIVECLEEEAEASSQVHVQWIVDLVRDYGPDAGLALLRDLLKLPCQSIVGLTLGGSEDRFPPAQFAKVYAKARDHGWRRTVHAGEALGPESVWDAIRLLGAERIGHGVRAIEDAKLVGYLAENGIPLEVCPTSNLRTGLYPSYEAHPVQALYEAGVPLTINSDDPTFFHTTLTDEYWQVHRVGIPREGLLEMIRNGFRYAFLPAADVDRYLANLNEAWSAMKGRGKSQIKEDESGLGGLPGRIQPRRQPDRPGGMGPSGGAGRGRSGSFPGSGGDGIDQPGRA